MQKRRWENVQHTFPFQHALISMHSFKRTDGNMTETDLKAGDEAVNDADFPPLMESAG